MDWKTLLFGFDGRIGRKQWWLAMVLLVAMSVGLSMLVNPHAWFGSGIARTTVADTLLSLSFLIPETAVSVKRFNDRGWPQWMPYGYSLMMLTYLVLDHFGHIDLNGSPTHFSVALVLALAILTVAIIIDNGFLRGTRGANRHGPDPLSGIPAATPAAGLGRNAHG